MNNEKNKHKIDYIAIIVSMIMLGFIVVCTIISSDSLVHGLLAGKNFLIHKFGFYFILFVAGMLFYDIYLAFSKYGNVRLGRAKPKYSNFGWIAMIFSTSMGASILFWSAIEWGYYIS